MREANRESELQKKSVLLLYTTHEGQTKKIMETIGQQLEDEVEVTYHQLLENESYDLSSYSVVLIGASIRYGHYPRHLTQFIQQNTAQLNAKLTGFIGVNLVARKANKNTPETNGYTRKFLASVSWKPTLNAVFAGALYYPKYGWLDKQMIRLIMWLGKGETDASIEQVEYTNWEAVHDYAQQLKKTLTEK